MERITSAQNPKLRRALRLHTAKGRQQQQRVIVFGRREIERAVTAGLQICELWVVANGPAIEQWLRETIGTDKNVSVFDVPDTLFQKLSYGDRSEQVVAIAERPATGLENFAPHDDRFLIVLESLEKPGNIGAIARSADGCGAGGIMIANPRTDVFHPNAIRASVSTIFSIPLAVTTSELAQQWLVARNYGVLVATPEAHQSIYDLDLTCPIAFVFGNEAVGLSPSWRMLHTIQASLPMTGIADSLNVSTTAAIMMYEAFRQRNHAIG